MTLSTAWRGLREWLRRRREAAEERRRMAVYPGQAYRAGRKRYEGWDERTGTTKVREDTATTPSPGATR
jgi:hypothetical protein